MMRKNLDENETYVYNDIIIWWWNSIIWNHEKFNLLMINRPN